MGILPPFPVPSGRKAIKLPYPRAVSYTHLDVYKRQGAGEPSPFARFMYSEEPLERQWAQVREVLLDREEQLSLIHILEGQVIHGRRNMGGNGFRLPVFLPAAVGYEVLPLPLLQLLQQVFIHFL